MTRDTSHLGALYIRLSHERERLAHAQTPGETELRRVWIAGIEKEILREREFLGLGPEGPMRDMTDDELLDELNNEQP